MVLSQHLWENGGLGQIKRSGLCDLGQVLLPLFLIFFFFHFYNCKNESLDLDLRTEMFYLLPSPGDGGHCP